MLFATAATLLKWMLTDTPTPAAPLGCCCGPRRHADAIVVILIFQLCEPKM